MDRYTPLATTTMEVCEALDSLDTPPLSSDSCTWPCESSEQACFLGIEEDIEEASQKRQRHMLARSAELLPSPLAGMSPALAVEDTSLGDDVVLLPYKPRRRRRPPVSPFPRILKRDLRRGLPTMYANV
eukprot:scaffold198_cov169-Ochromonas_danica.AAC.1